VTRLVYLAAFMPDADDDLITFLTTNSAPEFLEAVTFRDDGLVDFDMEVERKLAYQQSPSDLVDWALSMARPMAMGSGGAPTVMGVGWRGIPSTYVVSGEDGSILPDSQRQWAKERATDSVEKPWDHCPQLSHPEETADLLAALARA
jgi:pimeloyl-ACP methyl ester carboxylesterase